jgi:hypothetical protein
MQASLADIGRVHGLVNISALSVAFAALKPFRYSQMGWNRASRFTDVSTSFDVSLTPT